MSIPPKVSRSLFSFTRLLSCLLATGLFAAMAPVVSTLAQAQPTETAEAPADAGVQVVEVDWLEQMQAGGMTMVALSIVLIAGIAFSIERLFSIRQKYLCPNGLALAAVTCIKSGDIAGALKLAKDKPSTLGRIITFIVEHRDNDFDKLTSMAENLGAREIIDQEERTFPLAVVASIAPLLGLLGTMIGMIEAFQLVSIYGDEGGASMLAGSIAKALITTATGLILAIPAICAFHYFKHKIHRLGVQLDKDVEFIITSAFFTKSTLPGTQEEPVATKR